MKTEIALSGAVAVTNYQWSKNGELIGRIAGDLEWSYDYDPFGQLVSLESPHTGRTDFGYDGMGNRVRSSSDAGQKIYSQDYAGIARLPQTLEVFSSTTDGEQEVTRYLHSPNLDEPLAAAHSGGQSYFHADGLGSVILYSDSNGNPGIRSTFSTFGERTQAEIGGADTPSSELSLFGYTGREDEVEGLSYYRSRYLMPEDGRFITEDSFWGRADRPSSLNRFSYAENDPLNYLDPDGHSRMAAAGLNLIGGIGLIIVGWVGLREVLGYMAWDITTPGTNPSEVMEDPDSSPWEYRYFATFFVWVSAVLFMIWFFAAYVSAGGFLIERAISRSTTLSWKKGKENPIAGAARSWYGSTASVRAEFQLMPLFAVFICYRTFLLPFFSPSEDYVNSRNKKDSLRKLALPGDKTLVDVAIAWANCAVTFILVVDMLFGPFGKKRK